MLAKVKKSFNFLPFNDKYIGIDLLNQKDANIHAKIKVIGFGNFSLVQKDFGSQPGILFDVVGIGYCTHYTILSENVNKHFNLGWIPPESFYKVCSDKISGDPQLKLNIMEELSGKSIKFVVKFTDKITEEFKRVEQITTFDDLYDVLYPNIINL